MTLPPASANRSSILALASGGAPQPQSSPKVMVPSATSEIRTPVLPKSLYLIRFPHFFGGATSSDQRGPRVPGPAGRPWSASRQRCGPDEADLHHHHDTVATSLEGMAGAFPLRRMTRGSGRGLLLRPRKHENRGT